MSHSMIRKILISWRMNNNMININRQLVRDLCDQASPKPSSLPTQSPGSKYVKPVSGIRKYLGSLLFKFVEQYESVLEKKFPRTFKVYQVFSVGSKEFYNEMLEYFRVSQELSYGKKVRNLSYKELMTYYQMPRDMMKVGPVLAVAALPFANYVIFPLAYMFPKYLLSSHFWSIQQKYNFQLQYHTKKLYYYRSVFRHLQKQLANISNQLQVDGIDVNMRNKCSEIFSKLGSGTHPTVDEILGVKYIFTHEPFGLDHLPSRHLTHLCRMYGLNALPGKRPRLWNHIGYIRELDLAIMRHGVHELSIDEVRKALFMRGLNPMALSKDEMVIWLQNWLTIADNVDRDNLSLLLHCPILLAYNHPANWRLIH